MERRRDTMITIMRWPLHLQRTTKTTASSIRTSTRVMTPPLLVRLNTSNQLTRTIRKPSRSPSRRSPSQCQETPQPPPQHSSTLPRCPPHRPCLSRLSSTPTPSPSRRRPRAGGRAPSPGRARPRPGAGRPRSPRTRLEVTTTSGGPQSNLRLHSFQPSLQLFSRSSLL